MKKFAFLMALVPFLAGCGFTRIVTVYPENNVTYRPTTTVTVPGAHTVTTITNVGNYSYDTSLYLDLQAIGAAFAQSANVQDFEYLINNSQYMLSNLDLNRDGYVDYLRVMETVNGWAHVFVIQAVLAPNVYQDVATLVAEVRSAYSYNVQVIGADYIYGPKYIVQPVYVVTPPIFAYLARPYYRPWRSPWYWSHYPSCYRRPAPIHINHYMAYVHTYMSNHRYCHTVQYVNNYYYPNYNSVCAADRRNDYGKQYPERSFTVRNADTPVRNNRTVTNARDIREIHEANNVTTTSSSKNNSNAVRNSSTSTSARTPSSTTATSTSGSRTTTTATTTTSGNSTSGSSATRNPSTSTSARTPSSGTGSRTTTSTSSSTGNRGTATTSSAPSQQTTVRSNVSRSGSTRTSTTSSSSSSSTGSRATTTSSSSSRSTSTGSRTTTSSSSAASSSRGGATTGSSSSTRRR